MVILTTDKLQEAQTLIDSYLEHQCFLLFDENTIEHCDGVIRKQFPSLNNTTRIVIPAGEDYKTIKQSEAIWERLIEARATKKSLLINVGGGVVTDIGGYCAATYKRGIDFINIPTTLLAMVDACIGGKTAVNFKQHKNQIGIFKDAKCVYINPVFLQTLPRPELQSGLAEMIKHELLFNKNAVEAILERPNSDCWITKETILRSMQYKKEVVDQDYYDTGVRQSLNFGHTIGHAIESLSFKCKTPILHGEAVLLGMIEEQKLAEHLFNCPIEIRQLLENVKTKFFPLLNFTFKLKALLPFLIQDKKNDQEIRFSLLKNVAEPTLHVGIPIETLEDVLA